MNIFKRLWLALNQSICLIVTGQNDMTISGWSYIRHRNHNKSGMYRFVNKLFFWQENHCRDAFLWEWRAARTMCEKYDDLYELTHQEKYDAPAANVDA